VAPKLFVSYRREETAGHAGRLYDAIAGHFGDRNVFMDVDLAPGVDFVEQITAAVGVCDVLLVVMGPRWGAPSEETGRPRLEDPNDFVRLEVETALHRPDVRVIPLLVAGARMPDPHELPESVRALSRRNALELSDLRWRYDVGRLVSTLAELLEGPSVASEVAASAPDLPRPPAPLPRGRRARRSVIAAAVALGVAAAALTLAGVFSADDDTGRPTVAGNDGGPRGVEIEDAVRLVGTYERIYEAKDLNGLRRLLDPGVVLKKGQEQSIRGIDNVIAQYRDEFRSFGRNTPSFDWENGHTDSTQDSLEVSGPYVISVDDRREKGRFGFLFGKISSSILITEICLRCPDVRPGGPLARVRRGPPDAALASSSLGRHGGRTSARFGAKDQACLTRPCSTAATLHSTACEDASVPLANERASEDNCGPFATVTQTIAHGRR